MKDRRIEFFYKKMNTSWSYLLLRSNQPAPFALFWLPKNDKKRTLFRRRLDFPVSHKVIDNSFQFFLVELKVEYGALSLGLVCIPGFQLLGKHIDEI